MVLYSHTRFANFKRGDPPPSTFSHTGFGSLLKKAADGIYTGKIMCYNTLRRGKTSVAYPQNFLLSRKRDCLPLGEKGGVTLKQIWSKSLACLLCLALLVGMLPVAALAEDNPPANGEVSLADAATDTPIEIDSADKLAKIGADGYPLNGSYVLTANINLEASAETPWTAIGNFTGTFDGAGYKISGLYLNAGNLGPTDQGLGLFTMVGEGGTVENLTVKGEIDGTNAGVVVGGIVGKNNGGTISNCTSIVDITGSVDSNVGGIVGSGESGTIENCCNTGRINVTGSVDSNVGGIVGLAGNPNGRVTVTVENCENTGNVTVKGNADGTGGIVGGADSGTVSNCRNSGSIDGNESETGGIVGDNYGAISRAAPHNC